MKKISKKQWKQLRKEMLQELKEEFEFEKKFHTRPHWFDNDEREKYALSYIEGFEEGVKIAKRKRDLNELYEVLKEKQDESEQEPDKDRLAGLYLGYGEVVRVVENTFDRAKKLEEQMEEEERRKREEELKRLKEKPKEIELLEVCWPKDDEGNPIPIIPIPFYL
ncbi:hypothetical protein EDC32_10872 [Laceyella sacchari]|uniref:hypothetical protein n=1 Tax=Laceyella sacchari TaxID=37482 RepID=UPI00104A0046|nr:hypothetical protein [Laceyella sacchari]TCW35360.1 hypothetical protein EDC32_10872 [Laceyella sacchari]